VLDELDGDCLVIGVGHAEAFALDASLQGLRWGRPMTYQFTAALVRSLGGRVREVRLAPGPTYRPGRPSALSVMEAQVLTGRPVIAEIPPLHGTNRRPLLSRRPAPRRSPHPG
jgi:Domain of unknown function (DUF151)